MVVISEDNESLQALAVSNVMLAQQLYLEKAIQYENEMQDVAGEKQMQLRRDMDSFLDKNTSTGSAFEETDLDERYGEYT